MAAKLPDKDIKHLVLLYKAGATVERLASRYGVTTKYILRVLDQNKVVLRASRHEKKREARHQRRAHIAARYSDLNGTHSEKLKIIQKEFLVSYHEVAIAISKDKFVHKWRYTRTIEQEEKRDIVRSFVYGKHNIKEIARRHKLSIARVERILDEPMKNYT